MPDMIGASVISLMSRMDALERVVTGHASAVIPFAHDNNGWHLDDFTI
jgi:hypothetical protein